MQKCRVNNTVKHQSGCFNLYFVNCDRGGKWLHLKIQHNQINLVR